MTVSLDIWQLSPFPVLLIFPSSNSCSLALLDFAQNHIFLNGVAQNILQTMVSKVHAFGFCEKPLPST
jgi:hypothetical protein